MDKSVDVTVQCQCILHLHYTFSLRLAWQRMNRISLSVFMIYRAKRACHSNLLHVVLTRNTVSVLRCICCTVHLQVRAEASVQRWNLSDTEIQASLTVEQTPVQAIHYRVYDRSPFITSED